MNDLTDPLEWVGTFISSGVAIVTWEMLMHGWRPWRRKAKR